MSQPRYTPVLPFDQLATSIDAAGDCWEWTGHVSPRGYGEFGVKIDGAWRRRRAHRLVWTALCGPIPDNLPLDHLCRVRHCVNPDHLEPVPDRLNIMRGAGITALNAKKIACVRGHSDWRYELNREGRRYCATCKRLRSEAKGRAGKRGRMTTAECAFCHRAFDVEAFRLKAGRGKLCSRTCLMAVSTIRFKERRRRPSGGPEHA